MCYYQLTFDFNDNEYWRTLWVYAESGAVAKQKLSASLADATNLQVLGGTRHKPVGSSCLMLKES